jgi:hypothetical protein
MPSALPSTQYGRSRATLDATGRRDQASIRRPTAAMRPYSQLLSIQQSTKLIGSRLLSLKVEKVIINNNVY